MKRGRSAAFLKRLRKLHGLGEFSGKRKAARPNPRWVRRQRRRWDRIKRHEKFWDEVEGHQRVESVLAPITAALPGFSKPSPVDQKFFQRLT